MELKETPKMVFVCLTNSMGGAEQLILMLSKVNDSPIIFLKQSRKNCLDLGNKKATFLSRNLVYGFLLLIPAIWKYRKNYNIFSSHAYLNGFLGMMKAVGLIKSKLIARESTSLFTRYKGLKRLSYSIVYYFGYSAIDLVVCQTEFMKEQLLAHNKFIPESKVTVIPNPIELNAIIQKSLQILRFETNTEYVCAAGRLIPVKGFDVLIQAFNSVVKEHKNIKLFILGDGYERNNLMNLIETLGLQQKVILKGHVDNPIPYFKKAKVCVISSIQEGFPNSLLQMMAVNTNIVTTLCAGGIEDIPEIIKVEPNNVNDLAAGIKNACVNNSYYKRKVLDDFLKRSDPEKFNYSLISALQIS